MGPELVQSTGWAMAAFRSSLVPHAVLLRLWVMCLILNIIFSAVIVILAYKSTITFRFTL